MRLKIAVLLATIVAGLTLIVTPAAAEEQKKPNILIIWGDDIGYWNISAYNLGMMVYKTPNIDRIAKEGALFTDWAGNAQPDLSANVSYKMSLMTVSAD